MTTLAKSLMRQACLRAGGARQNTARPFLILIWALYFILQTLPLHATVTTVAYWRMGEHDVPFVFGSFDLASILTDETGNYPLTVIGQVPYSTNVSAAASTATGSSISANFFTGSYATNGVVSTATNNFGIEGWVCPTTNSDCVLFYNGDTGLSGWGIMILSGKYTALIGGKQYIVGPAAAVGVWTHVALVSVNGTLVLYVQGQLQATGTSVPATPTAGFALACTPQVPGAIPFTGFMDEVRVFTFAPGQFTTSDLLVKVWTPRLALNGGNPLFLKHQTLADPGVTVYGNVRSVSAGAFHSLIAKADGTVEAYGDDGYGQLSISYIPNNAVAVAAGEITSLALQANGSVQARGDNASGELNVPGSAVNVAAI